MSFTFRKADPKYVRTCVVCDRLFLMWRNATGKYCSRRCAWEARGGAEFNAQVARSTVEQRANAMRGRGAGRAYRKLGGRHEHRVIAEQKLGRALLPGEIVHHIDGNKLNNDPENLAVMTQSDHIRLHKPHRYRCAQ